MAKIARPGFFTLFENSIFPLLILALLYFLCKPLFVQNDKINYPLAWIILGIPFGLQKMFVWFVPHGYGIGGTVGVFALNIIIGGVIGGAIAVWRIAYAVYYIPCFIHLRVITRP